jgi:hypothetical protein
MGKIRCPLRPSSMRLDRGRPEILNPPEHPQACCTQQRITVPADVLAKTAQKHGYPSAAHRRSYARRTGAERGFATAKDPATNTITRGWCRLTGLTPLMLFAVTLLVVRNQRILHAWNTRQEENPAPRRQGPAPENPQTPPQGTRRAHRRRAALGQATPSANTGPRRNPPASAQTRHRRRQHARKPSLISRKPPGKHQNARPAGAGTTPTPHAQVRTGMSEANVKMVPTET